MNEPLQKMASLNSLLSRLLIISSQPPPIHQFSQIHSHFITSGLLFLSTFASNLLLKCSSSFLNPHFTLLLFYQLNSPNIFSYNLAIKALSQTSHPLKSFPLFQKLLFNGFHPNEYTFCFLLDCCSHVPSLSQAKQLHSQLIKHGLNLSLYSSTSLLYMYGCCGSSCDAAQVFHEMPQRSNVSWGAMIGAFLTSGELLKGLNLFSAMRRSPDLPPSKATLVTIISDCAKRGELGIGQTLHGFIVVNGLKLSVTLGTSLVDLYSNCGVIELAIKVFSSMPAKNVASWNCLIFGLGINGYGDRATESFERMRRGEVKPNGVTFLGLLQACSYSGLVNEGIRYFIQMRRDYGIEPSLKHYGCIIDLYGKAGRVNEAVEVIRAMPMKPDAVVWVALFSACRFHGFEGLGEFLVANVLKVGGDTSCGCLLLSDACAIRRRWDDVICAREMMREMDIQKVPGFTSIL